MAEKKPKPETREEAKPKFPIHKPKPAEPSPMRDILAEAAVPTPRTAPTPPTPPTPPTDATHPISPERDFTKVPNSVARDVIPAGHFTGKSKQLYDCLYQKTRGAILPTRRLAISKPDLMKASHIGSERTLLKNLAHLKDLGLLRVTLTDGRHEGNTYEVFTPEEAGLRTPRTPPTPPTEGTPRHARAEVPPVPPVESGVRGVGSEPLESTTSSLFKTSFKTSTESDDDDETFVKLNARFRKAAKEITGRESSAVDAERWDQLAELLVTELKIAAGRTTISSVPAFLTEHLRRRLWKKDRRQVEEEGKSAAVDQQSTVKAEASACPDCFGTGMWYPEGFEKGVARCRHERLAAADPAPGSS